MTSPLAARLTLRWREAADHVFLTGSTPWEVDEALIAAGFADGPYLSEDALGLDVTGAAQRRGPLPGRMLALGKLGQKTGAGWYRYPGGGGAVEDPIVADLALEEAHFAGLTRMDFTEDQIADRILLALLSAAWDALAAGEAPGWGDIDRQAQAALGLLKPLSGVPVQHVLLGKLSREAPALWRLPPG